MRIEISAGGIIYKLKDKKPLILLLRDQNDNWTFPKGLIEDDEDRVGTAKREISEEVGLKNLCFIAPLSPIKYWYRWREELIKKTVYYYLFEAKTEGKLVPQNEEGISEAKWFTPKEALRVVGYRKTNVKLLKEAIKKIGYSS